MICCFPFIYSCRHQNVEENKNKINNKSSGGNSAIKFPQKVQLPTLSTMRLHVWQYEYRCIAVIIELTLCRARDVPILLSILRSAGVYTGTACSRTAEQAPNNFPWLISRLYLYPTGGRVSPPIRVRRFWKLAKSFFILKRTTPLLKNLKNKAHPRGEPSNGPMQESGMRQLLQMPVQL